MSLFEPDSIAVIGASREKHKVGYQVLKNLENFKKVYAVNPKAETILGRKTYSSVKNIKEKVELVVICVPANIVPLVLKECGQKKVKYAIIISAGFKEVGNKKLENEIIEISKKYNIRFVGPNCFGTVNTLNNLNTSFSGEKVKKGNISFITQSGALFSSILDYAQVENIGFSKLISLGNKSDINEASILEELEKDKQTSVILIYTEGIDNGLEFFNVAKRITKPIIVLKAGKSEKARKSITFHTGMMAGSNEAYETAFKQAGIIEAKTTEELLNFGKVFSQLPLPKNKEIVIVSNAGGPAVLSADACSKEGIELVDLSKNNELKKILPKQATLNNPLDLIGDARHDLYEKSLNILLKDKKVGGAVVILTPQAMTEVNKTAEIIIELTKKYNKPILTSFIGGKRVDSAIRNLENSNIPNFFNPSEAVKCFAVMNKFTSKKRDTYPKINVNIKKAKKIIEGKEYLEFKDMKALLDMYKIPYAKSKSVLSEKDLNHDLKYPVILRIDKPTILHKTEVGGIILNISNKKELLDSFQNIKKSLKKHNISCKKFIIQEMKTGRELIIGMKNDEQFGPILMFGLGGLYTEVLKDVSFSLIPVSEQRAEKMIKEIKFYSALTGARGKPANINKIEQIILRTSKMIEDLSLENIDINPLIISKDGSMDVVDCKIKAK